jgi:acyl-CoA synthetase (AMP-forming)/AMP-acid ligase II
VVSAGAAGAAVVSVDSPPPPHAVSENAIADAITRAITFFFINKILLFLAALPFVSHMSSIVKLHRKIFAQSALIFIQSNISGEFA